MATHFSANQYENAFAANRLQNYQIPNSYKKHPTPRNGCTKVISNDRGHLLQNVPRSKESPWGNFKGTWELEPKKGKSRNKSQMPASNEKLENSARETECRRCVKNEKPVNKEVTFDKAEQVLIE